jgi:uncharacterized membrane protein
VAPIFSCIKEGKMSYPPPGGYNAGYPPSGSPTGKTSTLNLDYNVAAMLCYLPTCLCCINLIACILWLLTEPKESRFVRFHAMQGLLLFALGFAIQLLLGILGGGFQIGTAITTGSQAAGLGASLLFAMLRFAFGIVFLIIHIVGVVKAYQGQMWKLPVLGDWAERFA